jgi:hypothetical protein
MLPDMSSPINPVSIFEERLSDVNALLSAECQPIRKGYSGTHVHLGRKAPTMIVPDTPRSFPLKSSSVSSPQRVASASLIHALVLDALVDIVLDRGCPFVLLLLRRLGTPLCVLPSSCMVLERRAAAMRDARCDGKGGQRLFKRGQGQGGNAPVPPHGPRPAL